MWKKKRKIAERRTSRLARRNLPPGRHPRVDRLASAATFAGHVALPGEKHGHQPHLRQRAATQGLERRLPPLLARADRAGGNFPQSPRRGRGADSSRPATGLRPGRHHQEKSGSKIDGVKWRRDPLSPAFQTNLVPAQRFIQFSVAFPLGDGQARLVPVCFTHAPSAGKAPRKASEQELKLHREKEKQVKLNRWAIEQMHLLRKQIAPARRLVHVGDGSYINKEIVREKVENTVYIGRGRKDMALHHPPQTRPATGRRPGYGEKAPTPEQLRQDPDLPCKFW